MERASRIIVCFVIAGITLSSAKALAFVAPEENGSQVVASKKTTTATKRSIRAQSQSRDGKQLLIDARAAYVRGDYNLATALAKEAELNGGTPGLLFRIWGNDTPQKVLSDVAKARARQQSDSARAVTLQQRRQPSAPVTATPSPALPYSGTQSPQPVVTSQVVTPSAPVLSTSTPTPTAARSSVLPTTSPLTAKERQSLSQQLVQMARRHLAQGQIAESKDLAHKARTWDPSGTGAFGDGPNAVLQDIAQYEQIEKNAQAGNATHELALQQYNWLLTQSRRLHNQADLDLSQQLAQQAAATALSPSATPAFTAQMMLKQIANTRAKSSQAVVPAGAQFTSESSPVPQGTTQTPAPLAPQGSLSTLTQAQPVPAQPLSENEKFAAQNYDSYQLHRLGVDAMTRRQHERAITYFQMALAKGDRLDRDTRQQIQDHLVGLYPKVRTTNDLQQPLRQAALQQDSLGQAESVQQLRVEKLELETRTAISQAQQLRKSKPNEALVQLREAKSQLDQSGITDIRLTALQRRINSLIADLEIYRQQYGAALDLLEQNETTEQSIQLDQKREVAIQTELADLVDRYNQLIDERRFAEAVVVAEKAKTLAPDETVTESMLNRSRILYNEALVRTQQSRKETGFLSGIQDADAALINPLVGDSEYVFPESWSELVNRRRDVESYHRVNRTAKELAIDDALRKTVTLQYEQTPLASVLKDLATQSGIDIVLDPEGFNDSGVNTNTPVTIDVDGIMLKSALNLILEQLHLIHVVRDEVLKITTEARGRGELFPVVYPVGDLVLPIPNFTPNGSSVGSMLNQAVLGAHTPTSGAPIAVAQPTGSQAQDNVQIATNVLAQLGTGGMAGMGGSTGSSAGSGFPQFAGPGEMFPDAGGAANADFDSLIELIQETIEPDSWDEAGGPGSIREFPLNLSIIISATQDVHDQIESLLEQLRRLLDLQLAVEVRFVTLTDNFFERIGLDFDFDIDDDTDKPFQVFGRRDPEFTPEYVTPDAAGEYGAGQNPPRDFQDRDHLSGTTVGMSSPGIFSVDLDVPFRQNSFNIGVPQFGGFTPDAGAQLGFAILSDIEAFFFINAAQADRRTNVVQAPKVILFNGQFGVVVDIVQRPFLISVIPMIGPGAVGFTPIIQPFPTGTFMFVQGIISADRRYVRLNVFPFFFQLGEVFTYTTNLGAVGGGGGLLGGGGGGAQNTPVTLQFPIMATTTVLTTVNVPDGGTVLLGGVKRVNEGRTEAGVPILNKLPYVNRLFKNVGTGRETQSLMIMVTPRIIIGEEEEELQGAAL